MDDWQYREASRRVGVGESDFSFLLALHSFSILDIKRRDVRQFLFEVRRWSHRYSLVGQTSM